MASDQSQTLITGQSVNVGDEIHTEYSDTLTLFY